MIAVLVMLVGLVGAAWADEPAWYVDQPVSLVTLESIDGGLPKDNLEPLLSVRPDQPLDLAQVRQDIALLYRTGAFSAVEAHAEPWFGIDEDGEPVAAVWLVYRVARAPRIARIEVTGVHGSLRKRIIDASGLHAGEVFYAREDTAVVEDRVRLALYEAGWRASGVDVSVDVGLDPVARVQISLGEPSEVGEVRLGGNLVLPERRLERTLRRAGLARGELLDERAVGDGKQGLRELLVDRGWLQARVNILLLPGAQAGQTDVEVVVEAGPRLLITSRGMQRMSDAELREVIGLYAGDRVDDGLAERATEDLLAWWDRQGFMDARVAVELAPSDGDHILSVHAQRGPRHVLTRVEVAGADAIAPTFLVGAMKEADPDGLGSNVVSLAGVDEALVGVEQLYRGRGHLSAEPRLEGLDELSQGPLSRLLRRQPTVVRIALDEGPKTRLASLEVVGAGSLVEALVAEGQQRLVGEAYSAADLERLAGRIAEAYRAEGHLDADVAVEARLDARSRTAEGVLRVEPGGQLRLRSIVITGNRKTRRAVIDRRIQGRVGRPIDPADLSATRSQLYELDLFRVVSLELTGEGDRFRDLLVRVEEKSDIELEAGGGISSDIGVRVTTQALHRNIAGWGHRASALGQIGLAWEGETFAVDTAEPVWRAAVGYEAPDIPFRGFRLAVDALLNETVREPTFRLSRSGASVGLQWSSSDDRTEAIVDYRVQWRRLEDLDPGALVEGDPWSRRIDFNGDTALAMIMPSEVRPVGGVSAQFLRDGRDDRFNPRRGWAGSGRVELWDGLVGSDPAVRAAARMEQLVPLGSLVFALGLRGGVGQSLVPGDTLAIEDRFFMGGPGSLRGFALNTVGPANTVSRPDIAFSDELRPLVEGTAIREDAFHWVPTGGDSMVGASLELRIPTGSLGLPGGDDAWWVLFGDAGRVGFIGARTFTDSTLVSADPLARVGLGTGIRLATPIGPAAIDLGVNPWRLNDRDEPWGRVHLALGSF